jgi:hypothetical protein
MSSLENALKFIKSDINPKLTYSYFFPSSLPSYWLNADLPFSATNNPRNYAITSSDFLSISA